MEYFHRPSPILAVKIKAHSERPTRCEYYTKCLAAYLAKNMTDGSITLRRIHSYILIEISRLLGHSHSICIFDTNSQDAQYWHAPIYRKISDYILKGYAVVYILESDTLSTILRMSKMGIEVEEYIQSGALTIISNNIFYSPLVTSRVLIEQWDKLFSNIEKKNGTPKGFVAMGMPTSSFFTSLAHQDHLVKYESAVAKNYDGTIEAICCYTGESISCMPLGYIFELLNAHQNTLHKDYVRKEWSTSRGLSIVKRGLKNALDGDPSRSALSKILNLVCASNSEDRISWINQIQDNLDKVSCSSAKKFVLEEIKSQIMKEVVF